MVKKELTCVNVDSSNQPMKIAENSSKPSILTSKQAAETLGVSLRTLYAYVSRGKIGRTTDGATKESYFNASELADFVSRRERGRRPENVAKSSLNYGLPVLESRISTVKDGRPWYHGRDAISFSELATLEEAATLLWNIPLLPEVHSGKLTREMVDDRPLIQRFSGWLLEASADSNASSFATRQQQLALCHHMLRSATAMAARSPRWNGDIHNVLASAWKQQGAAAELTRRALVLHADHELNTSCFAVRCVASTQASPYASLLAGCCASMGERHGNFQEASELVGEAFRQGRIDRVIAARLSRSGSLPGFSHPLYPKGDPRAKVILDDLRSIVPKKLMKPVDQLLAHAASEYGLKPKNDLAVAAMVQVLGMPADAGQSIFLVGRTVGWCAHALEQYSSPLMIRPRARFIN